MKVLRDMAVVSLIVTILFGCAGLTKREQRVLSGGAIGAGVGTVGAAILSGPLVVGAAAGAAAGAIGGVVVDEIERQKNEAGK
jgi:hypothetical protein